MTENVSMLYLEAISGSSHQMEEIWALIPVELLCLPMSLLSECPQLCHHPTGGMASPKGFVPRVFPTWYFNCRSYLY